MTGLKSGSGDDLWGEGDTDEEAEPSDDDGTNQIAERDQESSTDESTSSDAGTEKAGDDADAGDDTDDDETHPYVVRRAIQDKSVQFEREERLTFFVHDDVVDGERDLVSDLESSLGRDVPKFDVREAVYRAALRNPDDVLDELLKMGYTLDE